MEDLLRVGVIANTHGIRGEVKGETMLGVLSPFAPAGGYR